MQKRSLLLIFAIIFFGCNNIERRKATTPTENIIKISSRVLDQEDTSFINNVSYIFLDVNKDIIIGEVDEILFLDNKFYIFDKDITKTIFVFNETGRFLYKIDKLGHGPGEYILPIDFDIDSHGNTYLCDIMRRTIIKYDTTGEFIEEYQTKFYFEEFCLLNEESILVRNAYKNGIIQANLGFINLYDNSLSTFINGGEIQDGFEITRFSPHYLFKSGNAVYYNPRFTNSIYKISEDNIYKLIVLDQSLFPSNEYIMKISKAPDIVFADYFTITDIRDIYEIPGYITFKYQRGIDHFIIFSKKTRKIRNLRYLKSNLYFGENKIYGVAGNRFISLIQPGQINKKWYRKVEKSNLKKKTKDQLLNLSQSSNPIICLIKINDF